MVEAWYPGVQAGPALVRTLFGDVNFSGKLTVSVPRSVGQEPLYYNALNTGRPADGVDLTRPPANVAEKYVSRYIDEQNTPLFPFGFGLSYTQFSYSPLKLSETTVSARALNSRASSVRISTTVTNTGTRTGREIVQLYIGQRGTSVARPIKELKGFRILTLAPGESQSVEFQLGRDELAFWNIDMQDTRGTGGGIGLDRPELGAGTDGAVHDQRAISSRRLLKICSPKVVILSAAGSPTNPLLVCWVADRSRL